MEATNRVIQEHEESLRHLNELDKQIQKSKSLYESVTKELALMEEVRVFLQELAEVARKEIASGLEQVVTLCLHAVFGEHLSFEIEIETSRNNTVIEFYVVDTSGDQVVRFSPEESMGGGVVDTVATGLRYGLLKILNPEPIGPIILDEPAKMISADLMPSYAALIQELTHMFEKQNILVTHHVSLMDVVDNAVFFEKVNGITKVTYQNQGELINNV